jgi:hypothetical protein
MTVQGELVTAGLPGVVRVEGNYSLWAKSVAPPALDLYWWKASTIPGDTDLLERVEAFGDGSGISWMNIEPDISASWPQAQCTLDDLQPVSMPHTLADVEYTHQIILERLVEICDAAVAAGTEVWDYRTLQVQSFNKTFDDTVWAAEWLPETNKIVNAYRGAFSDQLRRTNGGVLFQFYWSDAWNTASATFVDRAAVVMNRHANVYDALGIRSMPLLYPWTIGEPTPAAVKPEITDAIVAAARARYGEYFGVWNEVGFGAMPAAFVDALR